MAAYLKRIAIAGAAVWLCVRRVSGEKAQMADGQPSTMQEAEMWMMGASMMEEMKDMMMEGDESTTEYMRYMMEKDEEEEEEMTDMSTSDGETLTTTGMVESTTDKDMEDDDDTADDDDTSTKMMMSSTMASENMAMVQGSLTIEGLSYTELAANQTLKDGVIEGCKMAVADAAGPEVDPEDVACMLSQGSVQVDFTITPPEGLDASTLADAINGTALSEAMVDEVASVPGIGAATTGTLSVTNAMVKAAVVTSSMMTEAGTTSGMATTTATTQEPEGEVHQNSGAAGDRRAARAAAVALLLCLSSALPL